MVLVLFVWVLVLTIQKCLFNGFNERKTRTGKINYFSCHAEMNALYKFLKASGVRSLKEKSPPARLGSGATIYISRILNTQEDIPKDQNFWLGMSKPCKHCLPMLYNFNIKRIKYTDIIDGVNVLCELVIE